VWREQGDSLDLTVSATGRPAAIEIRSEAGRRLLVRYTAWKTVDGVAWPERLEIVEGEDAFEMALRVDRLRFETRPPAEWMALSLPASAERLDWRALKDIFARLGGRR
jgi:hypothetical protein